MGRYMENKAVNAGNVRLRIARKRFVRDGLPQLAPEQDITFLSRRQPIDDRRRLTDRHTYDRIAVSYLLDLVHREKQESSKERGRRQERGEEENLVFRRDRESRGSERRQEKRGEHNRDDASDAEDSEAGSLDLQDNEDHSDDKQKERNWIDVEPEADDGEEENDDPGDLGSVPRRRDAEDDEVNAQDEEKGRDEGVGEHLEEANPRCCAERHDFGARHMKLDALVDRRDAV